MSVDVCYCAVDAEHSVSADSAWVPMPFSVRFAVGSERQAALLDGTSSARAVQLNWGKSTLLVITTPMGDVTTHNKFETGYLVR